MHMALKPRWVHPLNFREQDKQLLDASIETAEKERIDFTSLCRRALQEYVDLHFEKDDCIPKLDEYLRDPSFKALPSITRLFTPKELGGWSDETLLLVAKNVRARKMELDSELKKRSFLLFQW